METRTVLRSLGSTTSCLSRNMTRRHQSTTSRTKKALKIAPHPSFLTPKSGSSHIIFNPPAAAPSVYHTPFKFLPKSDPRRQANLSQFIRASVSASASSSSASGQLPPALTKGEESRFKPRYNVTQEQVEEMRTLRAQDPVQWSVMKLADKFQCSQLFVMMCCKASAEHRASEKERKEAIRARWGPIRTNARDERQKRKRMLLKGEL